MSSSIVFERLHADARVPTRATNHSSGYDLYVYLNGRTVRLTLADGTGAEVISDREQGIVLPPGAIGLLPLGFKARLPEGFEAQIRMRSSWAFSRGLTLPNAPGTIDADYPDEWMVMLKAGEGREAVIRHGDRVAQAVLARYETLSWVEGQVDQATDRTGGFGSTG